MLIKMAKKYNERCKRRKIKLLKNYKKKDYKKKDYKKKYKLYLLNEFKKRFTKCKNQRCLLVQNFINDLDKNIKNELKKFTFKYKGPQGKFDWLSTIDIHNVMSQYERKYNNFKFLGGIPIDFAKLGNMLKINEYSFKKLKKIKKNKFGVIFNLDKHNQSGSHWVSLYGNLNNGKIYFFDSVGTTAPKEVKDYMTKFKRYCMENDIKNPILKINKIQHQYGNSECGVYSLNFIIRMLKHENFEQITNNIINDKDMNKCRNIYFL
jgi:hypothetical protein